MTIYNFELYERINTILLKTNRDIHLTVDLLLRENSDYSKAYLYECVELIDESIKDKILNVASRITGGSISKINAIIKLMAKTDEEFIEDEHSLEIEYTNLFTQLITNRYKSGGNKEGISNLQDQLSEIESKMRKLLRDYAHKMGGYELRINSLTRNNSRAAKYYQEKRSIDNIKLKNKRAKYKYELAQYQNTPEFKDAIEKIFNSNLESDPSEINATDNDVQSFDKFGPSSEWRSTRYKEIVNKIKHHYAVMQNGANKLYSSIPDSLPDNIEEYELLKKKFESSKGSLINAIEKRIDAIKSLNSEGNNELGKAKDHYILLLRKLGGDVSNYNYPEGNYEIE